MTTLQFQNGSLSLDALAYIRNMDDDERDRLANSAKAKHQADIKRHYITKIVGLDNVPILDDTLTRAEVVEHCQKLGVSFITHAADGLSIVRRPGLLVSYAPFTSVAQNTNPDWKTRAKITAPGFKPIRIALKTALEDINANRPVLDLRPKLLPSPQPSLPLALPEETAASA